MKCFVIGGTGSVGGLMARRLVALGHRVTVATRDPTRVRALPHGASAVAFQLYRAHAEDFAGHDRVFVMVPRGVAFTADQASSLFSALSAAGVVRVVLMTGLGVDRAVGSPLHRLEGALRESGLPHAVVRPNYMLHNLCGGALREGIARRDEIALPAGDARVSFVDARDVAEVAAVALFDDRERSTALNLTGPAAISYADIAESIGRGVGRPVRYRALSDDEAQSAFSAAGLDREAIESRLGFLAIARRGLLADVTPDVAQVLGRAPRDLTTFVADHLGAWSKEVS